ncbi:DUF4270 family protein [soil metagenome]
MNLWVKNCGLFIFLFLLFISCDDPTDIGEPINPNGDKVGVFFAEFPVSSSNILLDSVYTAYSGRALVGKYNDLDFGYVKSQSYTQFLPDKANPTVPDGMTVDSVVLTLRQNYFHGENFLAPQTVQAHFLTENLEFKSYFTFNQTAYAESVGEKTFIPNPEIDTIFRMHLTPDVIFRDQWLQFSKNYKADSTTISSFLDVIKGLALVPGEDNTVVLGFDIYHPQSNIAIHYHTSADTASVNFRFGNASSGLVSYNNIITDRSNTPLANITPHTEFHAEDNMIYFQPGTGLVSKINIDGFKTFMDTTGNIIINRADFLIGAVNPFSKYLEPPASISYYYTDESNKALLVDPTKPRSGGNFPLAIFEPSSGNQQPTPVESRISKESYTLNMTNILDAFSRDLMDVNEYLLSPPGYAISNSLRQAKLHSDNLKLKIYYTKLN